MSLKGVKLWPPIPSQTMLLSFEPSNSNSPKSGFSNGSVFAFGVAGDFRGGRLSSLLASQSNRGNTCGIVAVLKDRVVGARVAFPRIIGTGSHFLWRRLLDLQFDSVQLID